MIWSVAGLVAAGLAQGATAAIPQASPWPTVATTASVCLLATLATRALTRRRSSTKWLTPQTVSRQRGVWSVSAPDRV